MNSPAHVSAIPSKKERVSAEEWQLRVDLAAAYRLIAMYGWDDLIFTHISARIPGDEHHFLINPYGMMFEEITASSLVRIDQEGNKIDPDDYDINPAGFTIHSAIHAVREDATCVMHTHTMDGIAVSAQQDGLLPLSQQSLFPLADLAYHDYEGVALREDEKARLQKDLGMSKFMILRNHGLLTVAPTIADAFLNMYTLQRACEIQIRALSGNREMAPIPGDIVGTIKQQASKVTKGKGGNLAWPGLLRKLDRTDSSFRN
ncbi:MAG: class II aldolase [Alteromonadaceae bacterium]|uniref:class II aldolase/adducin family protein n=1 Tax=unclassified Marinobacter TaxID=83889 RepID=UPI000C41514B|nr:class II aldolase/adducin family protein [Marinobacter sp. BGYM27]MAA66943.1 class II aldolase [Alteromonadaceae bacterium]MBH87173.1 class II aldolase [Alteromonadaceae bacterium]MDG5501367.1 class II aldolase/adducin family protein [Marinobacter sp. BGYM27]|tara:strand:+ start:17966 stop:18745 length:780 start_codon:yes stop_codon:yes gene_type:complete